MSRPEPSPKVVEPEQLFRELDQARARGRTIVFTNGCFDLLHVGHLQLLEAAANEGDLLVVGVNRDESVTRLKGAGRPVVPFEERAGLLAGLAVVDRVTGFAEDSPLLLIERIRPDVLVKGEDWALDSIVGRSIVESRGGRVIRSPIRSRISTSDLIARVQRCRGPIRASRAADRK